MEFFLAWRYLRSKKGGEGFISLMSLFSFIGIALGVATLIIVLSVMNGFRHKLLGKILDFNAHVSVFVPGQPLNEYQKLVDQMQSVPGVKRAVPLVEEQAIVSAGKKAAGVMLRGLSYADFKDKTVISDNLRQGKIDSFQQVRNGIVIGKRLAEKLGVWLGGSLSVMVPQGQQTPFGYAPRQQTFQVIAIFDAGMSDYNLGFVFVPLATAQSLFKLGETVTNIEVDFQQADNVQRHVLDLRHALSRTDLRFLDWQKRNASFFEAVMVERNVMFIILTLIILIAAFNIISGLVMMIKDKTKAIGILRAIGAGKGVVVRIFFLVGSLIGIAGTTLGVTLGLLFCKNIESIRQGIQMLSGWELFNEEIYYLSQLPAVIDGGEVLTVTLIALSLTFLATLYPAWKASTLNPVEALRYEG